MAGFAFGLYIEPHVDRHLRRVRVGGVGEHDRPRGLGLHVERRQALGEQCSALAGVVAGRRPLVSRPDGQRDVADLAQLARSALLRALPLMGAFLVDQAAELVDLRALLLQLLVALGVLCAWVGGIEQPAQAGELAVVVGQLRLGHGRPALQLHTSPERGRVDLEGVEAVAVAHFVGHPPHRGGGARVLVLVGARRGPCLTDVLGGGVLPPGWAEHALQPRQCRLPLDALALALDSGLLEAPPGGVAQGLLARSGESFGQTRA